MKSNLLARIDAAIAAVFLLSVPIAMLMGSSAAEEAVASHGRNVDSGALFSLAAICYLLPMSFFFGMAAIAIFKNWRFGLYIHWAAASIACASVGLLLLGVLLS